MGMDNDAPGGISRSVPNLTPIRGDRELSLKFVYIHQLKRYKVTSLFPLIARPFSPVGEYGRESK